MQVRVGSRVDCHLIVEGCQERAFKGDDVFFGGESAALGEHVGDFGRVYFVHFAGYEKSGQGDLLVVVLGEDDGLAGQDVEVGHC